MTRGKNRKADWRAIAAALAARLPHGRWHPGAMGTALADAQRTRRATRNRGAAARKWAVAFSGGADSLALLLLLWAEGEGRWGREFVALHFNHRLRGRESEADEEFCRAVCAALGVQFVSASWNVGRALRPTPSTVGRKARPTEQAVEIVGRKDRPTGKEATIAVSEATARAARHEFFAREMKRRRRRVLWLAHQQDDIAETMLMRLTRGSGTGGLAAPRPWQEFADGRVHARPLLTLAKREIVAALRAAGAEWREDSSNATDRFFRNRVRRGIVPALARASGRDVLAAMALTRERLQEDDEALETLVDACAAVDAQRVTLDRAKLAGKPRALWRRALHRWLLAAGVETDLSRAGFEQLLAAVERGRATRFSLGARAFAVLREGKLRLQRA